MKTLHPDYFTRHINPDTKSVTYWAKHILDLPVVLTSNDLWTFEEEMKDLRCNGRICLHPGPTALLHEMIILEWSQHYFPPHKHPTKSETITSLVNGLTVRVFDPKGQPFTYSIIESNATIIVPAGVYHQVTTQSPYSIYRETKLGPFLGEADRVFLPLKG